MVKVLERLGHEVKYNSAQTCCGQPAFNSGAWEQAREVARHTLGALRDEEIIVTPSGSCGAMIKVFYRELFKGRPEYAEACALGDRTWEFASFLVNKLGVTDVGAVFEGKATFHDGCHGLRELRVRNEPRRLLQQVRGLELVELKNNETCCGFGGTFAVKYPMISTAMGEAKCGAIQETGADFVISLDSSCLMHLQGMMDRQGARARSLHLAEVLASGI